MIKSECKNIIKEVLHDISTNYGKKYMWESGDDANHFYVTELKDGNRISLQVYPGEWGLDTNELKDELYSFAGITKEDRKKKELARKRTRQFRQWIDGHHDYNPSIWGGAPYLNSWLNNSCFEEWTGLFDKDKVGIYEGDIIDCDATDGIYTIIFYNGRFVGRTDSDEHTDLHKLIGRGVRIISNIHELEKGNNND
jgi:hypothetical protein